MVEFQFMLPVKMTDEAQKTFSISAANGVYGIVLGECKNGRCIRIRKIGARSIQSWSKSFWEACLPDEAEMVRKMNV